jgi:hypothetical protein
VKDNLALSSGLVLSQVVSDLSGGRESVVAPTGDELILSPSVLHYKKHQRG